MSMPLQRGISGVRVSDSSDDLRDSQMKDKTERARSTENNNLTLRFPFGFLFSNQSSSKHGGGGENGFSAVLSGGLFPFRLLPEVMYITIIGGYRSSLFQTYGILGRFLLVLIGGRSLNIVI